VITVCQRGSASLEAGAVWGGLIGIGVAFRAIGVCANYSSCEASAAEIPVFDVALGVGALISGEHVIYDKGSGSVAFNVAPILANGKRGVALSVGFR
jgi:hypothetical protein